MSSIRCANGLRLIALTWLLGLGSLSASENGAGPRAVEEVRGRVVGVSDGDTVRILVNEKPVTVRLQGIDAPELGQSFGSRSKEALSKLVAGKTVSVRKSGEDQYKRTLGVLRVDGLDVNARLVADGWAWRFRYAEDKRLAQLEAQARAAKRGLWSEPDPLPPWEYRDKQSDPPRVVPEKQGKYWLNTSTGVRHNQTCANFGKTQQGRGCGPAEGRPCGICGG